jgi:hypothetical protein
MLSKDYTAEKVSRALELSDQAVPYYNGGKD